MDEQQAENRRMCDYQESNWKYHEELDPDEDLPYGKNSVERLVHFNCYSCEKWWSIGDAPENSVWFCPWCGLKQKSENIPVMATGGN